MQSDTKVCGKAGFSYGKNLHPSTLQWNSTALRGARAIRNAVFGERHGKEFAFFDCRFRTKRTTLYQSVMALHDRRRGFEAERLDPSLVAESVDDWTLLYRHNELFSLDELEAMISRS